MQLYANQLEAQLKRALAPIYLLSGDEPLLLAVAGKLDKQARAAKWVQALEGAGVAVTVYPVEAEQLPAWITQRMSRHGLKPGPGVAELLAHHMEGNLLAAAQGVEKLAPLPGPGAVRAGY